MIKLSSIYWVYGEVPMDKLVLTISLVLTRLLFQQSSKRVI